MKGNTLINDYNIVKLDNKQTVIYMPDHYNAMNITNVYCLNTITVKPNNINQQYNNICINAGEIAEMIRVNAGRNIIY